MSISFAPARCRDWTFHVRGSEWHLRGAEGLAGGTTSHPGGFGGAAASLIRERSSGHPSGRLESPRNSK